MSELTAKEIAQRIVNNANHLPEDNEFIRLAKAYLDQETRIQGLVETLEFYANGEHIMFDDNARVKWESVSGEADNWLQRENTDNVEMIEDGSVASKALTAYKEVK